MKKTYIIPTTDVVTIQQVDMIAQSFGADASTGNAGSSQLSKQDNDWDIWGDGE